MKDYDNDRFEKLSNPYIGSKMDLKMQLNQIFELLHVGFNKFHILFKF